MGLCQSNLHEYAKIFITLCDRLHLYITKKRPSAEAKPLRQARAISDRPYGWIETLLP
jgi:hypothetical protein